MSEEEILKIMNRLINDFKHFEEIRENDKKLNIYSWNSYDDIFKEYKNAIQGLLDLYNKEKEKNKELEYKLELEKIDNKYNKEEASEEMIPRYRLKAKIEELDNMKVDGELFTTAVNFTKKTLQELLEEE